MLKNTIKKWTAANESYQKGNINEALGLLRDVETTSKINYNIGVMYSKNANHKEAAEYFSRAIEQDKYLAVALFMRGVAHHNAGDLNHAIVDYDDALAKLRGHEFIDYKQLGLDYKLLMSEILFNKALALGKAGGSVANLAQQCAAMPSDPTFKDALRRLTEGQTNFKIRSAPLEILFKPPKVSEKGPPKAATVDIKSSPSSSPTSTSPASGTSPQSYTLRTPASSKPLPSPAAAATSASSASGGGGGGNPPKPPPLPSTKRLPSRPISMASVGQKITIKCFYQDRRLIQIDSDSCTLKSLRDKIEIKFEVSDLAIRYRRQSTGSFTTIESQAELDKALESEVQELYLSRPGEVNSFEADAASSPPKVQTVRTPNPNPPPPLKPKPSALASSMPSRQASPAPPSFSSAPTPPRTINVPSRPAPAPSSYSSSPTPSPPTRSFVVPTRQTPSRSFSNDQSTPSRPMNIPIIPKRVLTTSSSPPS
eukprot:gene4216-4912_t